MAIYLLIKEHKNTGLKYLCKHVASSFSECEKYKGSGVYWKKHLAKHGNDVSTTCLFVTENKQEFKKIATKYSKEYDVVNSNQWANLCNEEGQGGNTIVDKKAHGKLMQQIHEKKEVKEKVIKNLSGMRSWVQPLAAKAAKEKLTGVSKTEQHKENMRGKRPHVNQTGGKNNNAKKIKTPFGIFDSISDASRQIEEHTYKMIWDRLHNDTQWRYI
jgi:hypothetical protein